MIERFYKLLSVYEKAFFFLVVLAFSMCFFSYRYFVTQDGPSHLYNASLLTDLFREGGAPASDYFQFNSFPVPNWTGHIILALFNLFLPAEDVEKVFLFFYFIAFMYAFRYLVTAYSSNAGFGSLLILPFGISVFVYSGFYNFCLAFIFLFLVLGYYIRHANHINSIRGIKLLCLLLLIYFSHITIALFGVCFLFLHLFWISFLENKPKLSAVFLTFFKKGKWLFVSCMPILILIFLYAKIQQADAGHLSYLENERLVDMLVHLSPLVGHGSRENFYTGIYLIVLLILVCSSILFAIDKGSKKIIFKKEDTLTIIAFILILAYFILPNGDSKGGYISVRILYLFYLIVFLRIIVAKIPKWMINISAVFMIVAFYFQMKLREEGQEAMSRWATMVTEAGKDIDPNSVVLPINCSTHWQSPHLSGYLGVKRSLVLLDNYEAGHIYFPLKWKKDLPIPSTSSSHPDVICKKYFLQFNSMKTIPDYLFFYGYFEIPLSCENDTASHFTDYYDRISGDDFYAVYKKR